MAACSSWRLFVSSAVARHRACNALRRRLIHSTVCVSRPAFDKEFEAAKQQLNTLREEPDSNIKLEIYSLFKQSTIGKCNTKKPGLMDIVGKAKWGAWSSLGDMSQDDAQQKYINIVSKLASADTAGGADEATGAYKTLIIERDGSGVFKITLNRPAKKNAITYEMYNEWVDALEEAGRDQSITVAVVTGAGDFFCSGNDLSNFAGVDPSKTEEMARAAKTVLMRFVKGFIDFNKPLIGLVNGPAVGVSVTTLGLYDAVYASDRATFHTPFTNLGQSPEGCSSYIFPRIMGWAKANEMLLFNKKLSAQEAFDRNLVTEVIPDDSFAAVSEKRVKTFAALPPKTTQSAKQLIRELEKSALHAVCEKECDLLVERWQHPECMEAIMKFFQQKSNL